MQVRKAIIPCAGFGTRFLPATKAVPKEMFPIVDIPSLHLVVQEAVESGITDILIILGKNKKCIEDHFDRSIELESLLAASGKDSLLMEMRKISSMARICYCRQQEMNGSGMAVLEGETFVGNEPFVVIFGDDIVYTPEGNRPATGQLIDAYYNTGTSILGVQTVPREEAVKYGCVLPGSVKGRYTEVKELIEKPTLDKLPSNLASLGRFILTPSIFDYIRKTPKAPNGEVYLTDSMALQSKAEGLYAYDFEGIRYDVGDKLGYIKATVEYGLRKPEMASGIKEYIKKLASEL